MRGSSSSSDIEAKSNALGWIVEMELVSDPNFLNALILNIFKVSSFIKDVQLVCDTNNKKMLVWLELSRWGKWFYRGKVSYDVEAMLRDVLPGFTFRVVLDKSILDKALKLLGK